MLSAVFCLSFFLLFYRAPRDLHSFPTRRSSDLSPELRTDYFEELFLIWDRQLDDSDKHRKPDKSGLDRKSTRLNSSHRCISYAVFCLKKKKKSKTNTNTTSMKTAAKSYQPRLKP